MQYRHVVSLWIVTIVLASQSHAKGRIVARVFWQDDSNATVRSGDLKKSADGWSIEEHAIDSFPKLVQMRTHLGLVVVGVRDSEEGSFGSGWVAIESGVVEEPHGDHSHIRYTDSPRVSHSLIDTDQGNRDPADGEGPGRQID